MYLSHNIVNKLINIEVSIYILNSDNFPDKDKLKLKEQKESNDIFYLANEISIGLSLNEAKKVKEGKYVETNDLRGKLLDNYAKLHEFIVDVAENKDTEVSADTLLRLNLSLVSGVSEEWKLKIREAEEEYSPVYDDLFDLTQYGGHIINIHDKFVEVVTKYFENDGINQYYKFSTLVYELLKLQPFASFNKYTIMLVIDLLLARQLGTQNNFLQTGEFFTKKKDQISAAFAKQEEAEREVAWHELFLGFLDSNLLSARSEIQQMNFKDNSINKPFLDLNRRQLKILKYLQTIPTVKREDYVQMMDVSSMTAYRDLNELVKNKLIKSKGVGRGTKYMLASR